MPRIHHFFFIIKLFSKRVTSSFSDPSTIKQIILYSRLQLKEYYLRYLNSFEQYERSKDYRVTLSQRFASYISFRATRKYHLISKNYIDLRFDSVRQELLIRNLHSTNPSPIWISTFDAISNSHLRFRPPFNHFFIKWLYFWTPSLL